MPLQKLSEVAILVSFRNVGFREHNLTQGNQLPQRHRPKLGLRSTSLNAKRVLGTEPGSSILYKFRKSSIQK